MMPCDTCVETADHPFFNRPMHVVHPVDGTPQLYNVYGLAVCRFCGTPWYRGTDNEVRMLT